MKKLLSAQPKYRIIISGGGTGGHIFPAIAIADALRELEPSVGILFVGAKGKMEMEKVPAAGYKIEGLWISGLQRNGIKANLLFPVKVISSLVKAGKIINHFKPHVAVGVGGYASGPLIYVAARKGIASLIQEQNSFAGLTNKILGKRVQRICVAFDGMEKFFPKEKIIKTGNPVRSEALRTEGFRNEALSFFGLKNGHPTILIIGGSQGARSVNLAVSESIAQWIKEGFNIIWQTGKPFLNEASSVMSQFPAGRIKVYDFIYKMNYAYCLADLIVSRAGASTVSELCILGKPAILIPLPSAAEDHQAMNALTLVNQQAAVMIRDHEVKDRLAEEVKRVMNDRELQHQLSVNIKKLALPDAAKSIAKEVLLLAKSAS
ncbi:MAG: undecaprenyldiphospho-muramoylpentapeptide beta-N-acetylglucosaminyltransferase [Bacteroidia bacterium]|nr:undecaprenyldiphospho-muramoylpentapeptide beta-N-acetylglucosaminyltransferase [Bacteroidia bacterium]